MYRQNIHNKKCLFAEEYKQYVKDTINQYSLFVSLYMEVFLYFKSAIFVYNNLWIYNKAGQTDCRNHFARFTFVEQLIICLGAHGTYTYIQHGTTIAIDS